VASTALSTGLGQFRLGSVQSRAAARALVAARDASEPEEEEWENGVEKALAEAIRRGEFPDVREGEEEENESG